MSMTEGSPLTPDREIGPVDGSSALRAPGAGGPRRSELHDPVALLARRIDAAPLPAEARDHARREVAQLADLPGHSPHAARLLTHLDWMLGLPWPERVAEGELPSLDQVARALDETHADCTDVKTRVLESLAVTQLGGMARGESLLFLGPPGTGKSSMARALARALGRPFVPLSVGALTDERQFTGSPYRLEGAHPGAILDGLRRAGRRDAVILLDELDKLQLGGGGDAAGPLLELLDPDQRTEFFDHYLGLPFDLSSCLWIATANDTEEMPEPLLDRLEVIDFSGYTEQTKVAIAERHLLPRARARAGVSPAQLELSAAALQRIVRAHTEEAGVRQLQRHLDALSRKAATAVLRGGTGLKVRQGDVRELLGPPVVEGELRSRRPRLGATTGLAYTSSGGALLPIEAVALAGTGRTTLTGQVGEVMRESFQTALTWARSRSASLGLGSNHLDKIDLHLHFPASAVPKDGPSAGIAIAVALYSLLSRRPARHDVALTGELSLHGAVLPVGGLREKLLAAARAGLREVVVPARNGDELAALPADVRAPLVVHTALRIEDVLDLALLPARGEGRRRG
jgi:ATP-dependent Lon protease